jgi:hypothetical protein
MVLASALLTVNGDLDVTGDITMAARSVDPTDPPTDSATIWISDGTGTGPDGDIMYLPDPTGGGGTVHVLFDPNTPDASYMAIRQPTSGVTADSYFGVSAGGMFLQFTDGFGYVMPRAGSVISVAVALIVNAVPMAGDLTIQIRVNGSSVFTATSPTISAGGEVVFTASQDADVDSFAAEDVLTVFLDADGTLNMVGGSLLVTFDVQWDDPTE